MRYILQLFIGVILFNSCGNQTTIDNVYNKTYVIGEIPDIETFETYNEFDKRMEEPGNSLVGQGGFRNNRSRIFMKSFSNGKQSFQDSALYKGMPTPCYCTIDKDTITVKIGIGFFGGMGFETKIFKDNFRSHYFFYTDDVKPYKSSLSDKEFTDNVHLSNKYQSLILNQRPKFMSGQQLTGYLTFTSSNWYEATLEDKLDTNYVQGRFYFTCLTK